MVKRISIFIFLLVTITFSQTNPEIQEKSEELNLLHGMIDDLQNELKGIKSQAASSRKLLQKYDQENLLLNKAINNLVQQEKLKRKEIEKLDDSIKVIDEKMTGLQKKYAEYIRWLFMYSKDSKYKIIFSSASFNQAVMRYKYFSLISDQSVKLGEELKEGKSEQIKIQEKLKADVAYLNGLIAEKQDRSENLSANKKEKQQLLSTLSRNENNIEAEIDEKRKAEIVIKNLIVKLEEEERERERKRREERLKGNDKLPVREFNYEQFADFNELKGKLNWPVRKGKIIRTFGENKNSKLNTVTLNYGIDIETTKDETVRCVAEGVISAIEWLPGYGSVVIVTHKGKYRTVYGHISDIQVSENRKINAGDTIGKVNQTLEGSIIHFEVWSERNYQDPESWLVRK